MLFDRFTGLSERSIAPWLLLSAGLLVASWAFPFDTMESGTRVMLITGGGAVLVGSTWLGGAWYLRRRLAVETGTSSRFRRATPMFSSDNWFDTLILAVVAVTLLALPFQWRRTRRDPYLMLGLACLFLSMIPLNAGFLFGPAPHWTLLAVTAPFLVAGFVFLVIHSRTTPPAVPRPRWLRGPAALLLATVPIALTAVAFALADMLSGEPVGQTVRFHGTLLAGALGLVIFVVVLMEKFGRTSGRPILPYLVLATGLLLTGVSFPPQAPLIGPVATTILRIGAVLTLLGLVWVGIVWRRRRLARSENPAGP